MKLVCVAKAAFTPAGQANSVTQMGFPYLQVRVEGLGESSDIQMGNLIRK